MKSSVTKFDLEAAFKALEDIDYTESDKGLVARRKNLAESVKRSQGKIVTESLLEDYYDLEDAEDLDKAADARAEEVAQAKLARIEKIVDLDAKTADELLPSYVGKVIVQCPQCMTLFYKNEEDIEKDPDDPTNCNVNEPCQHCGNISGYTLIGKVDAVDEPVEEPVEEESEDSELDLNLEETEDSEESDLEADSEESDEADNTEEDQDNSEESEDDLDLNLESLNNSTNLSLNEAADFSEDEEEPEITMVEAVEDSTYYDDFLKNACYFINTDGFFDVEGSDVAKKVNDIISIFDEEIKDKSYGRATKAGLTSADLEIANLQNGGKRIKIKGLALAEALLTEETLEVATDKAISELQDIQDGVENNLDITSTEESLHESDIVSATDDALDRLRAIQADVESDLGINTTENLHESVSSVLAAFEASLDSDDSVAPVDEALNEADDLKNLKADRDSFKKMINSKTFKDFSEDLEDNNLDEAIAITINVDEIEDEVVASDPCDAMIISNDDNTAVYNKDEVVSPEVEEPIANAVVTAVEPEIAEPESVESEDEDSTDLDEGVLSTIANGAKAAVKNVKGFLSDSAAKDVLKQADDKGKLVYTVTDEVGASHTRYSFQSALSLVKELSKDQKTQGKPLVIGVKNTITNREFPSLISYKDGKVLNNHLASVAALIDEAETKPEKPNPTGEEKKDNSADSANDAKSDNNKAANNANAATKVQKVKQKLPEITQETVNKVKDALGTLSQADTQKLLKLLNRSKTGRDMINNMSQDKAIFAGMTIDTGTNSTTAIESFIKNNYDVLAEALCEMGKIDLPTKLDSIEECDEDSINNCITEALQKVYTNVSSFNMTDCSLNNNKLVLEGLITFKSGKTRHTSYQFNEATRNADKLHLHGLNEAFGRDSKFDLVCKVNNKNLVVEKLSYNYKAANTIVEGLVEYNK